MMKGFVCIEYRKIQSYTEFVLGGLHCERICISAYLHPVENIRTDRIFYGRIVTCKSGKLVRQALQSSCSRFVKLSLVGENNTSRFVTFNFFCRAVKLLHYIIPECRHLLWRKFHIKSGILSKQRPPYRHRPVEGIQSYHHKSRHHKESGIMEYKSSISFFSVEEDQKNEAKDKDDHCDRPHIH